MAHAAAHHRGALQTFWLDLFYLKSSQVVGLSDTVSCVDRP